MACAKVKEGLFDVLKVNKRMPLKKFLESKKIRFEKGRTFYEMTKSEIIQDYKVLVTLLQRLLDCFHRFCESNVCAGSRL